MRMEKKALTTRSMDITERLTRRIISGEYPVGSKLPTERALAEEFDVARHVIREALKRIEAVGLVKIRQGSGIYVQRLHFLAGIEIFDILLTDEYGAINYPFLLDVMEFRKHIVRTVVNLSVERHTDEEEIEVRALFLELLSSPEADRERVYEALFERIAYSTHNQVYALLFNSVGRIFLKLRRTFEIPIVGITGVSTLLGELLRAYSERNSEAADLLIMGYLEMLDQSIKNMAEARAQAQAVAAQNGGALPDA